MYVRPGLKAVVTEVLLGNETIYVSMNAAATAMGIVPTTLKRRYNDGKQFLSRPACVACTVSLQEAERILGEMWRVWTDQAEG